MADYVFKPKVVRDKLIDGIRAIAEEQSFTKVVVGISGGKDSTVTAALCARALGKENVYGVLMPDGGQLDISDSYRVCKELGINCFNFDIGKMHTAMLMGFEDRINDEEFAVPFSAEANINVAPRLRMTVLRYITQALGARLAGTGNLSEVTVGYCTKDGDTSCDFSVLGALTSVEVVRVGLTMKEIPADLVTKTPTDGLSGMSDEEKLGVSYEDIHKYIRNDDSLEIETWKKIRNMETRNLHKRISPPIVFDPFAE